MAVERRINLQKEEMKKRHIAGARTKGRPLRCAAPRPGRQGAAPRFPPPPGATWGRHSPRPRGAPPARPDVAPAWGAPNALLGSRSRLRTLPRPPLRPGAPGQRPPRTLPAGRTGPPGPSVLRARARFPSEGAEKGAARVTEAPSRGAPSPPQRPRDSRRGRTRSRQGPCAPTPGGTRLRELTRSGPRRCGPRARPPGSCFLAQRHVSPPAAAASPPRPPPSSGRRPPRRPGVSARPAPSRSPPPSAPAGALRLPLRAPLPARAAPPRSPPSSSPASLAPPSAPRPRSAGSAPSGSGPAGSSEPPPPPQPGPQLPAPHL
ncbi:basic proline-rich protein-like [Lutra lutra]|uniref:basic proline-rich protein-like n=1 Tax=Lutra lutra TaxID=9657 RepID=UPI001FD56ED3|nr:basic proline-rich protein-like [Lutra lutra]